MFLLLGGGGYVGQSLIRALQNGNLPFRAPSHQELDASSLNEVRACVQALKPTFVINATGFTGRPNIDGTEREKLRCLQANTTVPGVLAEALRGTGIRWGHVSSGCIYEGSHEDGRLFTENDPPNFAFSHPRAGWYARTKAMAEILLKDIPDCLIWRLRIPFDEFDHERNYLSKLMRYDRLLQVTGSISQLQEFATACITSLQKDLPGGIYNVTNPGAISTSDVAEAIRSHGLTDKTFQFFSGEDEFMNSLPGRVHRASCLLSSEKIISHGIPLREVHEALDWTLRHWQWER